MPHTSFTRLTNRQGSGGRGSLPVTHRVFEGVDRHFTHAGPVPAGKEAIELMASAPRSIA